MTTAIVWFRRDLRLEHNPAWIDATRRHDTVVPLFVADPRLWDRCAPPSIGLLAENLRHLDTALKIRGGRLRVHSGDPAEVVPEVAERLGAGEVIVNADVTPFAKRRDVAVAERVRLTAHWGSLVHPPGAILTESGTRYRIFTPFSKTWFGRDLPRFDAPGRASTTDDVGEGLPAAPDTPLPGGAVAAWRRLEAFDERVDAYTEERDRPDTDSTSRLSIDLKYGTISPVAIVELIGTHTPGRQAFVRQLAWRDFYAHLMDEMPRTVGEPMRTDYATIAWREDDDGFEAWQRGMTGYPIVDAGMRQLSVEGWMHNRVRMIAASFLVKDLLIDWRRGERHFRRHLLDGDVSQNVGNWQWTAGTGTDAAPYFRVFNPVAQSRRFDPEGRYIRHWVRELRDLPTEHIHAPWAAPPLELAAAGFTIGDTYPAPIVDHADARTRAIEAYEAARAR